MKTRDHSAGRTMKSLFILSLFALAACTTPSSPAQSQQPAADSLKKAMAHVLTPEEQDTLQNGHAQIHRPSGGLLMEGDKLNGKRNGVWTSYTEQGGVQSRNDYVDGVLQGQSIVFRPNGAVYYQGEHRIGKQVGAWKFYDEQGTLAKTVEYDTLGNIVRQP
jgi:hypothetical protein